LKDDDRFKCSTLDGYVKDNPLRKFDLVVASDVIEHLADPDALLDNMKTVLDKNGIGVISTPDAGSFTAWLIGANWHHVNEFHFSLFSKDFLISAIEKRGFQILSVRKPFLYRQADYILRYVFRNILGIGSPSLDFGLKNILVPINLFDCVEVFFKKI